MKQQVCLKYTRNIIAIIWFLQGRYLFYLVLIISFAILNCCSPTPEFYRFDDHLDEAIVSDKKVVVKHHIEGIKYEFDNKTNDWFELGNSSKLEIKNNCLTARTKFIKKIEVDIPEQVGIGTVQLQVINPPFNEKNSSAYIPINIIASEGDDKVLTKSVEPQSHSFQSDKPVITQLFPYPVILGKHKKLTIIGENFDYLAKVKLCKPEMKPIFVKQRRIIKNHLHIRNLYPLRINTDLIREIVIKIKIKGTSNFFIRCSEDLKQPAKFVKVNISPENEFFHCRIIPASLRSFQGSIINYLEMKFYFKKTFPDIKIDYIRFLTKSAKYISKKLGVSQEIINNQLRNGIFIKSPNSLEYKLRLPKGGKVNFGMGILSSKEPITFSLWLKEKNSIKRLFYQNITDHKKWHDASVKIPPSTSHRVSLIFRSETRQPGSIAFWSNPYLIREGKKNEEKKPNIIIYLIDALRADNLGVYGYFRAVSPHIDQIARHGVLFLNCYSTSSWTRPAVPSLLTSLYPSTHGIIDYRFQLPHSVLTLAEILRAEGYLTAMMTDNPHIGSTANLQQGFDFVFEQPAISGFFKNRNKDVWLAHNSSALLNKKVFPWLEHNHSIPFFLFIHNMDAHAPYTPPPYVDIFDLEYSGYINGTFDKEKGFQQAKTLEDRNHVRALYDAEIRNIDKHIQRLMEKLYSLHIQDKTFFIITADHGEEFLDHNGWTHASTLYNELLQIPLILYYPNKLPEGKRIKTPVSIVDIMPTTLDLLKISSNAKVEGESLLPIIADKKRKQCYIFSSCKGRLYCLIDSHWKFIFDIQRGHTELYDLKNDPKERINIALKRPDLVKKYSTIIKHRLSIQKRTLELFQKNSLTRKDIRSDEIEALKALGYLQR